MAGTISMGARREVLSAVAERYRSAGRVEKGRILDALCRTTGWHRKHAVRALRRRVVDMAVETEAPRERKRRYGATIKDALTALWEAADRVCGKRLVAMIPALVPALAQHGRLQLSEDEQAQLHTVSAATIDRMLGDVKGAAGGGRRRRGRVVVEAIKHAQSLFPWLLRGVDFDNDSAFMNEVVVPWCREQKLEVTRSRAYKKNDQTFLEQKNGAVVRRLMGYGRFDGLETAGRVMSRLYAAARLYVNFFQPSFKLKEKRREGAKVIKRYHAPSTPYQRALAHPKVTAAVKKRLRDQYRSLDPVALLAEIRATQEEL